jgi:membrane-associated phospholipid phosphatase
MKLNQAALFNKILWAFLGCSCLLLAVALSTPKGQDVLAINGLHTPLLDGLFKTVTQLGNGIVLLPLFVVALFIQFRLAAIVASAGALHGILVAVCKRVLFAGWPRPKAFLDNDLLHFVPGVSVHAHHSFPSGHTATAFLLFFLISHFFGRKMPAILISALLAALVGISRVYLVQHFLIDVACGALLGTVSAWLCARWLDEKNPLPAWMFMRIQLKLTSGRPTTAVK